MLLFDLPKNYIAEILSEWIFSDSLARYDSAIQNRKLRGPYLDLLQTAYFVSYGIDARSLLPFSCVLWLIKRNIKIRRLTPSFGLADDLIILDLSLSKLEYLDFSCSQFENKNNAAHLLDKCASSLVHLNFSANDLVTVSFLRAAVRKCTKLRTLNISNCKGISDVAVRRIAPFCGALTALDLSRCSNIRSAALTTLAPHCHALVSLSISGCSFMSDASILALCVSNSRLTDLSLGLCCHLSNASLLALLTRCSEIRHLDLNCCAALSEQALFHIADRCRCVESLNVACCEPVTDEAVVRVVGDCLSLTALNISNCTLITDLAIAQVAARGGRLAELNLTGCHLVTHSSVALLARCGALTRLFVNNCCKVRDHTAILQLISGCRSLRLLDLRGTTAGHREEIAEEAARQTAELIVLQ